MLSPTIFFSVAAVLLTVLSYPVQRDVDASLVPDFGVTPGVKDPAGSASCVNPSGVLIPCQCPPSSDSFIAELNKNVDAGFVVNNPSVAVSFPEDGSTQSQLTRLQACLVTLQNLNGTGQGCPVASTDWIALQEEITAGNSSSSSAVAGSATALPSSSVSAATSIAAASSSLVSATTGVGAVSSSVGSATSIAVPSSGSVSSATSIAGASSGSVSSATSIAATSVTSATNIIIAPSSSVLSANSIVAALDSASTTATVSASAPSATVSSNVTVDPSLVPDFGITAGANATGTGDCSGANGVEIPCTCPPDRNEFIGNLSANVAAGFVLTNPTVSLTFPLDSSPQSALARLDASLVTLQNQRGTGVGCPAAATTWVALQKSIQAQIN